MVLILSPDEYTDPVGLRIDVSNEMSRPSCKATDIIEGDGASCDESHVVSVSTANRPAVEGVVDVDTMEGVNGDLETLGVALLLTLRLRLDSVGIVAEVGSTDGVA